MADGTGLKRPGKTATVLIASNQAVPELIQPLRQRIASSLVDEFVAAHGIADVFRELVQNEFDAGGAEIGIRLTSQQLEITGTGRPISPSGWTRLSVIVGTGEVLGNASGEVITPKESSIGSKNLGLRSLFQFGDRIHVRSNGRMGVLDLKTFGTANQVDPGSKGRKGVLIQVPLRTEKLRRFESFTLEREERALDDIERVLFPTLVKLALTGRRSGVTALVISSERLGRRLQWRQSAETFRTKVSGISGARRVGRSQAEGRDGKRRRQTYEELEFSRLISLRPGSDQQDFPDYYQSGDKVRIAVSVALKNGKPVNNHLGHCYYPLQASQARTGCAVSVSAPFQLDAERTRLIASDWNIWLSEAAADLVADLVGTDWFARFGIDAYKLILSHGPDSGDFADRVLDRLRTKACWPNAEGAMAAATSLVTTDHEALRGHLGAQSYLHFDLAGDPNLSKLALNCGAKRFTVNSLVRLRCGGQTNAGLRTKLEADEANYHYSSHPGAALKPDEQHRTANALTQLQKRLSQNNRLDLAETASTLSATGKLLPATKLVRVEPDMWEACPEPMEQRLHPRLFDDMAIARHCRTFALARWIEEAAGRAAAGTSQDTEREALYRHLLAPGNKLTSRLVGVIRKSPVLRDDLGRWSRPDSLALLPPKDAAVFGAIVPAPAPVWRQRADLLERLAIRRKIHANDLVALAHATAANPDLAPRLEDVLRRHPLLLTANVIGRLAGIACLANRAGGVGAPSSLHLPTPINLSCLSDAELLLDDRALYRRLGCPAQPSSAILIDAIDRAREAGLPPPAPHQLYPALVEALRNERLPALALANRSILYVKDVFASPHETLVTLRAPRCLEAALPVVRTGSALADAYAALGASALPKPHHWVAFFDWIDRRVRLAQGKVPALERAFLREAYRVRGHHGLPPDLAKSSLCLLSSESTAHSLEDLQAGRFVEDDFPELAQALLNAKAGVAFADPEEASRIFFRSLGIGLLSDKCGEGRVVVGAPASAPNWFQVKTTSRALEQLHRPDFAEGLSELAYARQAQSSEFRPLRAAHIRRRLQAIQKIIFSADLQRNYQLGRRVSVPADAVIDGDTLYLTPPRYRSEYDHIVALELARLAGAVRLADVRALASALLPLLQAERPAEVLAYLARLGIRPAAWEHLDQESEPELDEAALTREQLAQSLMASVHIAKPSPTTPPAPTTSTPAPAPLSPSPPKPLVLPPLDAVTLSVSAPTGRAPAAVQGGTGGSWRSGSAWSPRTPAEIARDREVGLHGEALVYRAELERVRALGHTDPEAHVVWVSKTDPGADHDIRSVDADGGVIWIEVKSTTGSDGRFDWSIAEFEKALREGARYQLWRVYGAGGNAPLAKRFVNPAALLKGPTLRLELGTLRAFVEAR
jgi:Domain of unknown function (DUF3883)